MSINNGVSICLTWTAKHHCMGVGTFPHNAEKRLPKFEILCRPVARTLPLFIMVCQVTIPRICTIIA